MRTFFIIFLFLTSIYADEMLRVDDFEVTLFSKSQNKPVQIYTSMIFEGRDVELYDFKIIDALNVIISSFFAEDLLTSKGKEAFKKAVVQYSVQKYSIDIDAVYILKLHVVDDAGAKAIVDALKKEGCCQLE